MKLINRHLLPGLLLAFTSAQLAADEPTDIDNYLQYSPSFSSSGQPSAGQLKALSKAGFKRVIYIASTFSFLYRVIYGGVALSVAKSDLDTIWQPDKVWYLFIVDVLKSHGLSEKCDDCDWGVNEFKD